MTRSYDPATYNLDRTVCTQCGGPKTGKNPSYCSACWSIRQKEHRRKNPDQHREYKRKERERRRDKCIEAYGGVCACCGEHRKEFLGFDHIDGGGAAHRREIGSGQFFTRWLVREGFPDSIRLLCHNCNQSRGAYGYCPHERERQHAD